MYIDLVRKILEEAVDDHATDLGCSKPEILAEIKKHIDATAKEHRRNEPEIDYQAPLCRLGYLYRHATANATLFERVLRDSENLAAKLRAASGDNLHICSVGGGPGTELLGLAKRLHRMKPPYPRKISFTVLDSVNEWADTWRMLADACEEELHELAGGKADAPVIAAAFLAMDVLNARSYVNYRYELRRADIIVLNYLFSENKHRLANAADAIRRLWDLVPRGCVFVVIDRLERQGSFVNDVAQLFVSAGAGEPEVHRIGDYLDLDEQTDDMGKLLMGVLGSPRVKFFTDGYRDPTVFWFDAVKEK